MRTFINAWRHHPWLVGGLVAAIIATLFFGTRMVFFTIYWSDPAHRDQEVQGWMTPGYVAHSWDIPRGDLLQALGDLARPGEGKTLEQIAEDNGIPLQELTARIEAVITAHRAGQ
jgi:hypothetical protein